MTKIKDLKGEIWDILYQACSDEVNQKLSAQLLQLFQTWALEIIEDDGFCILCHRVVVVCMDDPCQFRDRILKSSGGKDG